jgi:hypothetical protein
VVPPEVEAPVLPDVPVLLVAPLREGAVVVVPEEDGGEAVPVAVPAAAPMPDADPEAVPDTGPVLHAASVAAHASAMRVLIMSDAPYVNGHEPSMGPTRRSAASCVFLFHVGRFLYASEKRLSRKRRLSISMRG